MSPAAARLLPRTRTFQRRRQWVAWWIAAGIAVVVNLGLVVLLSQISRLHAPAAEAPQVVRTIRQVEPDVEPPPPPAARERPPELVEEPVAVALPELELLAAPSPAALALPNLANPALTSFDLPLSVPDFVAFAPATSGAGVAAPVDLGDVDQTAELDVYFNLERYYPRAAKLRGVTGQSRVRLTIAATGAVTGVQVVSSTPDGVFEQATERLGYSLVFRPAKRDGRAVASTKDLIIDWTLK